MSRQPQLQPMRSSVGRHFRFASIILIWQSDGYCAKASPELLFTDNETNFQRLFWCENHARYVKDGINDYVVAGAQERRESGKDRNESGRSLPPDHWRRRDSDGQIAAQSAQASPGAFGPEFDELFRALAGEANEFYQAIAPAGLSEDERLVQRQAFAGLLWSKQFYNYDVRRWLRGDPAGPEPPRRAAARAQQWLDSSHNADVISMPDKWEYPWYAAWDLAFHCIPLALIDPDFAKEQLLLLLREWYMHPNGQLPAYEWNFSDVNPPVHAWAVWRVYKIEQKHFGRTDRSFLERAFHKLLLNFTWWVNRKDAEGNNIFQGGFLGSG